MFQKKFEAIELHDLFDKNFEILKHLELKKKKKDFTLALSEIKLLVLRHLIK